MIACVQIEHFATAVECRTDPALSGVPLVLLKYSAKRGSVAAVSREAESAGVEPGMSPSRARALCPEAHTLTFESERCHKALDGAQAKGVESTVASAVFDTLRAFGGYSFPKSHAAAFAVLVYQSAAIKKNCCVWLLNELS